MALSCVSTTGVNVGVLREASIMALLGLLVSSSPLVMGVVFAIRPTERRLALMRPLSLAGLFAGVCSLLVGLANVLRALVNLQAFDAQTLRPAFVGLAETVVLTFVAFACLTVAWLCVAMGMRKLS
jgi:hypothetical protein